MTEYAPETGPDGRPRPRFGEYATPEEQRARIRQPDASAALSAGESPAAPPAAAPPRPTAAPPVSTTPGGVSRGRAVDRILTWGLLGYGLFVVLTSIPSAVDYPWFADTFLSALGVDAALSDPQAGRWWGLAAALVLGLGWLAAAVLSWVSLRAGRISFWIPLTAGIVCNVVSSMLLMVPLMTDSAVWSAIESAVMGAAG